ncbi:MAG TPA: hypothetical protein VI895_02120 [Bdellovibrionota bacterium]|nr:hypothetical protein [Bdellovibrionota bacterium]
MQGWDKTMFEIYREAEFNRRYHVIYFTELGNHDRDEEIPKAVTAEHVFDGFLSGWRKEEAKYLIEQLLTRLNQGETLSPNDIRQTLKPYLED